MAITQIPDTVYRLGILRNIPLPSGYFSNQDTFWLQNQYTTGGVLIDGNNQQYFASKTDAERYIGYSLFQVRDYRITSD